MSPLGVCTVVACLAVLLRGGSAANIIFPGATPANDTQQLVFNEEPLCAKGLGICDDEKSAPPDYPLELVEKLVSEALINNVDPLAEIASGDVVLGERFGDIAEDSRLTEESPACIASEAIIYPTMGKNDKNNWLYVVNSGQVKQGIRVEKCVDEGKPCRLAPEGTICRQKYIYRKLLAVDSSRRMTAENFRIPSCCVCYIKNEFLTLRFGNKGRKPAATPAAAAAAVEAPVSPARRRSVRQAGPEPELDIIGGETTGLTGSPLDNSLAPGAAQQGTAQQSIETEETLNPSDTIGGQPVGRFAGEIVVHSNPIVVQKKPPKPASRPRN